MLEALTQITVPSGLKWEIIAVDNGSEDRTVAILTSFEKKLPLTIISQPKPGKNAALNKGLEIARAEFLVFTDDDIIPDADWLVEYFLIKDSKPEYDLFGGHILPHWITQPRSEVIKSIPTGIAYALTPTDLTTAPIKAGKIWGPNMAVRKTVFSNGFRFNEDIGPNGKNYVMGSETDFLQRAEKNGHKAFFVATAKVQHIIRPWQITDEWLRGRAYKAGRAIVHDMVRRNDELTKVKTINGYPRWAAKTLPVLLFKRLISAITGNNRKRLSTMWEYYMTQGYCAEYKQYQSLQ